MKTREETGCLQTDRCPASPAHSPQAHPGPRGRPREMRAFSWTQGQTRGNTSPLPDPGADPGRQPHPRPRGRPGEAAPRHSPAATTLSTSRNCGEAPTSPERNWAEAQMETGAFCVILNFPEPRRRSPWLCMNFSDLMGWPGGRGGGGGGGPRAPRPLPTEARTLNPRSRLAQATLTPAPAQRRGWASAPTRLHQDAVPGRRAASWAPAAPEAC